MEITTGITHIEEAENLMIMRHGQAATRSGKILLLNALLNAVHTGKELREMLKAKPHIKKVVVLHSSADRTRVTAEALVSGLVDNDQKPTWVIDIKETTTLNEESSILNINFDDLEPNTYLVIVTHEPLVLEYYILTRKSGHRPIPYGTAFTLRTEISPIFPSICNDFVPNH